MPSIAVTEPADAVRPVCKVAEFLALNEYDPGWFRNGTKMHKASTSRRHLCSQLRRSRVRTRARYADRVFDDRAFRVAFGFLLGTRQHAIPLCGGPRRVGQDSCISRTLRGPWQNITMSLRTRVFGVRARTAHSGRVRRMFAAAPHVLTARSACVRIAPSVARIAPAIEWAARFLSEHRRI